MGEVCSAPLEAQNFRRHGAAEACTRQDSTTAIQVVEEEGPGHSKSATGLQRLSQSRWHKIGDDEEDGGEILSEGNDDDDDDDICWVFTLP